MNIGDFSPSVPHYGNLTGNLPVASEQLLVNVHIAEKHTSGAKARIDYWLYAGDKSPA